MGQIKDKMLNKSDGAEDELTLMGCTVGSYGSGDPCVIAATDSMAEEATWVYITLEDAVSEIIENKDSEPAEYMAERIRMAVEQGIQKGIELRRKAGR